MSSKFFHVVLFFSIVCLFNESAFAETIGDLDRCRYKDGGTISPDLCLKLRNSELRFKEKRANEERIRSEQREVMRIENEERQIKKANDERTRSEQREAIRKENEERRIKQAEENLMRAQQLEEKKRLEAEGVARRKKQYEAEAAEDERRERVAAKRQAQIVEEKKAICGDDYGQAKIGMSLARAQQCVAKFKLSSEINRADGIISTYTAGAMYIHVMNGRIVSWGR